LDKIRVKRMYKIPLSSPYHLPDNSLGNNLTLRRGQIPRFPLYTSQGNLNRTHLAPGLHPSEKL
jgi:hypothetical protein